MKTWTRAWIPVKDLAAGAEVYVPHDEATHAHWGSVAAERTGRGQESSAAGFWDEIVSIKKVGREQVYDIEVDGTHNFVAGHLLDAATNQTLTEAQEAAVLQRQPVAETADAKNEAVSRLYPRCRGVDTPQPHYDQSMAIVDELSTLRYGGLFAHNTFIDSNASDTVALDIDAENTTTDVLNIAATVLTTGRALDLPDLDALTTGTGLNLVSNSSDTSERYLVNLDNDNTAATGTRLLRLKQDAAQDALHIQQIGAADALFIDQDSATGTAINIDSESTTADVINLSVDALTTGRALDIPDLDALTTGTGLNLVSNSSNTSERYLAYLHNRNASASGAVPLRIVQEGAGAAFRVDDVAGDTTPFIIDAVGQVGIGTTNPSTNLHLASTGDVGIFLRADTDNSGGEGDNPFIKFNQDGGSGLTGFGGVIGLASAGQGPTEAVTNALEDALVIGTGDAANELQLYANNAVAMTIIDGGNVGIGTTGPGAKTEIEIGATDAVTGLLIDANDADQISFQIDAEQTTADIVDIQATVLTTGRALDIPDLDALTTGTGINVVSNSSSTSERYLAYLHNRNSSASGAVPLRIVQEGAGAAFRVDDAAGDTSPFLIDASGNVGIGTTAPTASLDVRTQVATGNVIDINATNLTTGIGLDLDGLDGLTTGTGINVVSNSSDSSERYLVNIDQDAFFATGARALRVKQDADQTLALLDQNGNGLTIDIDSEATTADILNIQATVLTTGRAIDIPDLDALTTGTGINVVSNSSSTSERYLVNIDQDHASASGAVALRIKQDGAADALQVYDGATKAFSVADGGAITIVSSGSLTIPVGTGPTVDASGEIAIDTTADQFIFYGSAAKRVLTYQEYKTVTLESPADADNFNLFKAPHPLTITDIECLIDPADTGESVVIDVQERDATADNPASVDATITCDNDGASDDGTLTNGPIDSGDWVSLDIGAVTGTVTQLTVTVTYTVDAQ